MTGFRFFNVKTGKTILDSDGFDQTSPEELGIDYDMPSDIDDDSEFEFIDDSTVEDPQEDDLVDDAVDFDTDDSELSSLDFDDTDLDSDFDTLGDMDDDNMSDDFDLESESDDFDLESESDGAEAEAVEMDDEGGEEEEDQDYQGNIRTVRGAHLVYKRATEGGNYEELWVYNVGKNKQNEEKIRNAILAGTDVTNRTRGMSEDGAQNMETYTVGNVQYIKISGLPN